MSDFMLQVLGVQSFEVIRKDDFIYIDKTELIWKLVNESRVHFLSRPRRFGKNLFLLTLKAYFLGQKELFKGLALETYEEAEKDKREIRQEYPVLYLDFTAENYRTLNGLETLLNTHLSLWEKEYGTETAANSFASRFYKPCGRMKVSTKPTAPPSNFFFGVIKSADQYIRFAFLTGVTQFSKVSIFSDLNNLRDLNLLSDYSAVCGISQEELEKGFVPEIQNLAEKTA